MTSLQEYAAMSKWSDMWQEPISKAVRAFLDGRSGELFTVTELCRQLGFQPNLDRKLSTAFVGKLHALREGPLGPYSHPSTRPVSFKNKDGSPRMAVEWRAPTEAELGAWCDQDRNEAACKKAYPKTWQYYYGSIEVPVES